MNGTSTNTPTNATKHLTKTLISTPMGPFKAIDLGEMLVTEQKTEHPRPQTRSMKVNALFSQNHQDRLETAHFTLANDKTTKPNHAIDSHTIDKMAEKSVPSKMDQPPAAPGAQIAANFDMVQPGSDFPAEAPPSQANTTMGNEDQNQTSTPNSSQTAIISHDGQTLMEVNLPNTTPTANVSTSYNGTNKTPSEKENVIKVNLFNVVDILYVNKQIQLSLQTKTAFTTVKLGHNTKNYEMRVNIKTHYAKILAELDRLNIEYSKKSSPEEILRHYVIYGVDKRMATDEIIECLREDGYNAQTATLMTNRATRTPYDMHIIGLTDTPEAKSFLEIKTFEGMIVHAKDYIYSETPNQCRLCQRFHHGETKCKARPRCRICAGEHTNTECTKDWTNPEHRRCSNCDLNHMSTYRQCKVYLEAEELINTRKVNQKSIATKSVAELTKPSQDTKQAAQNPMPQRKRLNNRNRTRQTAVSNTIDFTSENQFQALDAESEKGNNQTAQDAITDSTVNNTETATTLVCKANNPQKRKQNKPKYTEAERLQYNLTRARKLIADADAKAAQVVTQQETARSQDKTEDFNIVTTVAQIHEAPAVTEINPTQPVIRNQNLEAMVTTAANLTQSEKAEVQQTETIEINSDNETARASIVIQDEIINTNVTVETSNSDTSNASNQNKALTIIETEQISQNQNKPQDFTNKGFCMIEALMAFFCPGVPTPEWLKKILRLFSEIMAAPEELRWGKLVAGVMEILSPNRA